MNAVYTGIMVDRRGSNVLQINVGLSAIFINIPSCKRPVPNMTSVRMCPIATFDHLMETIHSLIIVWGPLIDHWLINWLIVNLIGQK